jgi:hypothetical protein
MKNWKRYAKAFAGGIVAAASFAIPVVNDGLVPSEALGIVVAFFAGLGIVYQVKNQPMP